MKKVDVLVILFIIFSSLYTLKDLFLPGMYTSHDGPHQIVRAFYYHDLIKQGQFPPRYVFGLNYGFGYPLFIFSYHMPWLIAEVFNQFGLSIIDSVKMTFMAGFIFSGIFMYFYQKMLFGRLPAFVGALIYLFSPFRFSNIFVRSALGDATALMFAPLIFWSFDLIRKSKRINYRYIIFLALSLTMLLLSHAMIFFFYVSGLFLYGIYRLVFNRNKIRLIMSGIFSIIIFVFYSSFYLLPSFIERSYTKFSDTMGPLATVTNFLPVSKLIYSPWGYGTVDAEFGPMSLSVGPVLLFIGIAACLGLVYISLKKRNISELKTGYGFIFLLIFVSTIVMMLPQSLYLWQFISRYIIIDFNWRILSLTVFTTSILSGWLIYQMKSRKKLASVLGLMLLILAFYTNRNHLKINQTLDWSVPFFLKLEKTTNSFDEYSPKWFDPHYIKEDAPKIAVSDRFTYEFITQKDSQYDIKVKVLKSGRLALNVLYYPGWSAYVNGKKVKIDYEIKGLIEIPFEPGEYRLVVKFEKTPLRNTADFLTLGSLIITGVYLLKEKIYA